jgi:hypothetical protein
MTVRDQTLQHFFDLTESAILLGADSCDGAKPSATRIFSALRNKVGPRSDAKPESLPVCSVLEDALHISGKAKAPIPELGTTLAKLSPGLVWQRRKGAELEPPGFFDGHANAYLVGPGGVEIRNDVWIGISLMAPHVRYPNHRHPPEEIYVSLAGGDWKKEQNWHRPKPGGLIYNEPNVLHAMATDEEPLLAIWCLWVGEEQNSGQTGKTPS